MDDGVSRPKKWISRASDDVIGSYKSISKLIQKYSIPHRVISGGEESTHEVLGKRFVKEL